MDSMPSEKLYCCSGGLTLPDLASGLTWFKLPGGWLIFSWTTSLYNALSAAVRADGGTCSLGAFGLSELGIPDHRTCSGCSFKSEDSWFSFLFSSLLSLSTS